MAYVRFLGEWYNLPWLAAVAAGLLIVLFRRPGAGAAPAIVLVVAGVAGLTINGALHDLRLGPIGPRFPLVAASSLVFGALVAWVGPRLRRRVFPPLTGVTFNEPGLEGKPAVVLSGRLKSDPEDRGARARYRDEAGVSHVVRIHAAPVPGKPGLRLRFGTKIRLGAFDVERQSYPALSPED